MCADRLSEHGFRRQWGAVYKGSSCSCADGLVVPQIDQEAYTQAMDYRLSEWRYAGPRGWQCVQDPGIFAQWIEQRLS